MTDTAGPESARAWRVHRHGRPADVLQIEEIEVRPPGPGEVRVAVEAFTLNFNDLDGVYGRYRTVAPPLPYTPGMEVLGRVESVGEGATAVVGDRVVGRYTYRARHAGPFVGVWDGALAAFDGARQLLSFQRQHVFFTAAGGDPFVEAGHNLMLFAFLAAAVPMTVGVLRRLPPAYGAYVLAALALPLSYPVTPQPLMSLPRFLLVLFPLNMWLAAWLAARPRARMPALVVSAALMAFFVGQFATWHWVA